jgi:hypothetical protein
VRYFLVLRYSGASIIVLFEPGYFHMSHCTGLVHVYLASWLCASDGATEQEKHQNCVATESSGDFILVLG